LTGTATLPLYLNISTVVAKPFYDPVDGPDVTDSDPSQYTAIEFDSPEASLGNRVWEDRNANGIQDNGEPGVDGVIVQLLDSSGNVINSDTTDQDGIYGFGFLATLEQVDDFTFTPIAYGVRCVLPEDYAYTPDFDQEPNRGPDAGDLNSNADPDDNGFMGSYILNADEDLPTIDCGLIPLAGLGNFVWLDANRNGIQELDADGEPVEAGIEGVEVTLRNPGDNGTCELSDEVLESTTTEEDGYYEFFGLMPGDYCVTFEQPADLVPSPRDAGNDDALDSDGLVSDVVTLDLR
jgi:serine-aspartate repeat-containing protein C/D/E